MKKLIWASGLLLLLTVTACQNKHKQGSGNLEHKTLTDSSIVKIIPEYAQGFKITYTDQACLLDIQDPQNKESQSFHYALVPRGVEAENIPADYTVIETPIRSVICMTSLQLSNFIKLEELDAVVGITSTRHLFNKKINDRLKDGSIHKIGIEGNFDNEVIMSVNPDLILISPFKRGGYDALKEVGIPLMPHLGYKEMTPLGQAEWIKFVGLLLGKEEKANEKEQILAKRRKHNMKLYPIYIMMGFDLLFFYGIRVMFFSQVKGFTNAQIMLSSSLYAIFTVALQLPATLIVTKVGKKYGAILGNIFNCLCMISMFFINNFIGLTIAQFISAVGLALKNVSDANILSSSIPEGENASDTFTKIDKVAYSRYCFMSAATTVFAGYIYDVNPYIPICLCLVSCLIATFIAFNFSDIEEPKKNKIILKDYLKEFKQAMKFTVNSKRLRALLLTTGVAWGIITLIDVYQLALLQDIGTSSFIIGIVFAMYEISRAIFSRLAPKFNQAFGNKSLTNILLIFSFGMIMCGIMAILNISFPIKLTVIVICILTMGGINAIEQILAKKYMNNFANHKVISSIYAAKSMSDNLWRTFITGIGSLILTICNVDIAIIAAGVILIIVTFILALYMSTRLGLEPDEYTQKDIYIRK